MVFALRVAERPCEHDDISDRASVHLSGITFACRGGAAPAGHVTVTMMKCVGSRKHGSWLKTQRRPHMTSQEQRDARTEWAQTPHLPVRATALRVTPLFDTSCPGLTTGEQDREIKGHAAQVSRKQGAMVATRWSDVARYQRERGAGARSAAPRRALPEKHVRVSSGPVSTGPACRSAVSRPPGNNKVHHVASPWQTSPAEHGPG